MRMQLGPTQFFQAVQGTGFEETKFAKIESAYTDRGPAEVLVNSGNGKPHATPG